MNKEFKRKFLILYSWFVRTLTFFLPEIPFFQRVRGRMYALGMAHCGKNFKVSGNVIFNHLGYMTVKDNVYFANNCVVSGGGLLFIGNNVLVGPNVVIATDDHKFNGENFLEGYDFGIVTIEDNCWIGANVTILKNSKIPVSSIVAAGSVCNKEFDQPYSLIGGVPARMIKSIKN